MLPFALGRSDTIVFYDDRQAERLSHAIAQWKTVPAREGRDVIDDAGNCIERSGCCNSHCRRNDVPHNLAGKIHELTHDRVWSAGNVSPKGLSADHSAILNQRGSNLCAAKVEAESRGHLSFQLSGREPRPSALRGPVH